MTPELKQLHPPTATTTPGDLALNLISKLVALEREARHLDELDASLRSQTQAYATARRVNREAAEAGRADLEQLIVTAAHAFY